MAQQLVVPTQVWQIGIEQRQHYSVLAHPFMRFILFYIIEAPLCNLYLNGPSLGGWGFWESKPFPDICAQLTNVPSLHWEHHLDACKALINRRFDGILVSVYFLIYISTMGSCVCCCILYWTQRLLRII
jgi:hypothetical protein